MSNLALFAVLSVIWGLTWAAVKLGLGAGLPPVMLAALRYLLAAGMLVFAVSGWREAFADGRSGRLILSGVLTIAGTYGLMFWGMQTVPSGLSGLVNLSLVPVFLFALAALTQEERPTWRHGGALALGCLGLAAIFADQTGGEASPLGLAAIVMGTACYCIGSVIARPLLDKVAPLTLTMIHSGIGGAVLLAVSLGTEELRWPDPVPAALSLSFLAIFGTIVAYTLYLRLLAEWGTARAGLYAFVSPIVALAMGAALFGESVEIAQIVGTVLLSAAAAIAIRRTI